jgi:hypothetical protein
MVADATDTLIERRFPLAAEAAAPEVPKQQQHDQDDHDDPEQARHQTFPFPSGVARRRGRSSEGPSGGVTGPLVEM